MGRRSKQTFLQRRHTDGPGTLEKSLNIAHYYRNANQNHNEVSPHTSQNGHHQKIYKLLMLERMWRKGNLLAHCWWECKLTQPLCRTIWSFLKKLGIKLQYDPATSLLGIYPKKTTKDTCTPMFTAALFTIARTWKKLRCSSTGEWIKKLDIHNGILLNHIKKQISVSWTEVDEPRACYTEWNKS